MKLLLLSLFGLGLPGFVLAAGNPSESYMRIYAFGVSTSPFCTTPIWLFDSATPREVNMFDGPALGGGDIPDGTYQCVIMKMSDSLRFKPASNDGTACVAGTSYNLDVCRAGTTGRNPNDNSSISCTGNTLNAVGTDTVYVFLSTTSTNTAGSGTNAFLPPATTNDATQGMRLDSPFVVNGSSSGQFVMDLTGKIDGTGSAPDCDLQPPAFRFR